MKWMRVAIFPSSKREKTIILNVDERSTINKVILGLVRPQSDHSKVSK